MDFYDVLFAILFGAVFTALGVQGQVNYIQSEKLSNNSEKIDSLQSRLSYYKTELSKKSDTIDVLESDKYLWLSRVIYSETNRKSEMGHIGWVVRNRVEKKFLGDSTYKDVILHPYQFSAFNPNREDRYKYLYLDRTNADSQKRWEYATKAAIDVILSDRDKAPFNINVLYFWSEVSRTSNYPPHWVKNKIQVPSSIVNKRFRFYSES